MGQSDIARQAETGWCAVVPMKRGDGRKSRLAPVLSLEQRGELADSMADHVLAQLQRVDGIERIMVLAPHALARTGVDWVRDAARGLNAELDELRREIAGPMLVIHADLPFLDASEVSLLLAAARDGGSAIAPDRHGKGTNAIALLPSAGDFAFGFGTDSCARHRERLGEGAVTIDRPGLSLDIDTPADLADARQRGLAF